MKLLSELFLEAVKWDKSKLMDRHVFISGKSHWYKTFNEQFLAGCGEENQRVLQLALTSKKVLDAAQIYDKFWFDGNTSKYTCFACNMGQNGDAKNADGHDFDCIVSLLHTALQEMEKGLK